MTKPGHLLGGNFAAPSAAPLPYPQGTPLFAGEPQTNHLLVLWATSSPDRVARVEVPSPNLTLPIHLTIATNPHVDPLHFFSAQTIPPTHHRALPTLYFPARGRTVLTTANMGVASFRFGRGAFSVLPTGNPVRETCHQLPRLPTLGGRGRSHPLSTTSLLHTTPPKTRGLPCLRCYRYRIASHANSDPATPPGYPHDSIPAVSCTATLPLSASTSRIACLLSKLYYILSLVLTGC